VLPWASRAMRRRPDWMLGCGHPVGPGRLRGADASDTVAIVLFEAVGFDPRHAMHLAALRHPVDRSCRSAPCQQGV
jgi:hypothetical protein